MINKLVELKEKSFEYGSKIFNELKQELKKYISTQISGDNEAYTQKFIGLNVVDITNWLYNNSKFYEYLEYSFLGKYYEKKINLIEGIIILIALLIGILMYCLFGLGWIFIIICALLILTLIFVFSKFKTGEPYKAYYNRTMLELLLSIYGISFSISNNSNLTDEELKKIITNTYTKKTTKNNMIFNGNLLNGNILDLELTRTTQYKTKSGETRKKTEKIFKGFYLKIKTNNNKNMLRGNTIKIKADENILSSIAEDTVKGIYESQKDFSFTSEEMNKSFDCKISGYNGFNDVDDMMLTVHKIITPSFEQHLLYLRERYNTFSMNIDDTGIYVDFVNN